MRNGHFARLRGARGGQASAAVAELATAAWVDESLHAPLAEAGALPLLVALLRSTDAAAQVHAADALAVLAMDAAIRKRIVDAGAVPGLVSLLHADSGHGKVRAVRAIGRLAYDAPARLLLVGAGALPPLVALLRAGTADGKRDAAYAIGWLASDAPTHLLLVGEDALPPLVALLRSGTGQAKVYAAAAIGWLAKDAPTRTLFMGEGVLPPLVAMLRAGNLSEKMGSAFALAMLAEDESLRSPIVDAGALPPLVALLGQVYADGTGGNNICSTLQHLAADAQLRELAKEHGAVGALAAAATAPGCAWAGDARAALRALCPTQGDSDLALGTMHLELCVLRTERDASAECFESLASLAGPVSKGHDVVFRLSDGEIGCSRLLLARASPYYEKYLFGGTAESASVVVEPDPDFSSAAHIALLGQLHVMGHTPLLVELNARLELLCLASQPRCAERPADAAQTRRRACSSGASARCATCSARTTASPCCCSLSRTTPMCRSSSTQRTRS